LDNEEKQYKNAQKTTLIVLCFALLTNISNVALIEANTINVIVLALNLFCLLFAVVYPKIRKKWR